MEIERNRMIHLGYGKYWRSDEIVGLLPIEQGRGPGRRTEVYVSTREEPVVASRSETSILQEMASLPDEALQATELRALSDDLLEALDELSPVLRRMLKAEGKFDVQYWAGRLRRVAAQMREGEEQEDLFRAG